jgi:hypothetical protein
MWGRSHDLGNVPLRRRGSPHLKYVSCRHQQLGLGRAKRIGGEGSLIVLSKRTIMTMKVDKSRSSRIEVLEVFISASWT